MTVEDTPPPAPVDEYAVQDYAEEATKDARENVGEKV
jgi:hypothetical protein